MYRVYVLYQTSRRNNRKWRTGAMCTAQQLCYDWNSQPVYGLVLFYIVCLSNTIDKKCCKTIVRGMVLTHLLAAIQNYKIH